MSRIDILSILRWVSECKDTKKLGDVANLVVGIALAVRAADTSEPVEEVIAKGLGLGGQHIFSLREVAPGVPGVLHILQRRAATGVIYGNTSTN